MIGGERAQLGRQRRPPRWRELVGVQLGPEAPLARRPVHIPRLGLIQSLKDVLFLKGKV